MRQLKIGQTITNKDSDVLDKYLNDISKIELLTLEEEADLAKRAREGDDKALERLVNCNLRFVVSVAKKYQHRGMALGDLINEGNLGLIRAAHRFNETKGFKFISFAVWWIRQGILQALSEQTRVVRIPLNQISCITKLNRAAMDLEQELHRDPSEIELSEFTGIELERITDHMEISKIPVSLDAVTSEEIGSTLLDTLFDESFAADKDLMHASFLTDIKKIVMLLPVREREIIIQFFGLGTDALVLDEIAIRSGLSKERVRQLKDKAIRELQRRSKNILNHIINDDERMQ